MAVLVLALCCAPCLAAGYIYLDTGTQPDLVAHATGENRFAPGDEFELDVVLSNTARDPAVQIEPFMAPGVYDPATALGVLVTPDKAEAPVTLNTLPTVAGDIGSWDRVPVTVRGTIDQDATPGPHVLLLMVSYQYVYAIPMTGTGYSTLDLLYRKKEQTLPVTVRVTREVRPSVLSETEENLVPGTQGYLALHVRNTGYATGSETVFRIVPADNTTFQMVDQSVFLGRFAPGDAATVRARLAVREHTGPGSYPATLEGQYLDANGVLTSTPPVPVGIRVSRGAVIEVKNLNQTIAPGGGQSLTVSYTNTGDTPARYARARIIGSQVVVPVTESASLGTLAPNETRTAEFEVALKSPIAGKRYVIDTEVKYRDGLGALMLSDPLSFGVVVAEPQGTASLVSDPAVLVLLGGVLLLLAYAGWKLLGRKLGRKGE
jgi:hypothetical protein